MGKRGPKPKPTALKKLQGTYQPCRAAKNEIAPTPGVPPPPAHLDAIARAKWEELVPQLAELGVLSRMDGGTLEALCVTYSQAVKFQKSADKTQIVKTAFGPKVNPAVVQARKSWALWRQFAQEFGLSPSARTRVGAPEKAAKDGDETAKWLFEDGKPKLSVISGQRRSS